MCSAALSASSYVIWCLTLESMNSTHGQCFSVRNICSFEHKFWTVDVRRSYSVLYQCRFWDTVYKQRPSGYPLCNAEVTEADLGMCGRTGAPTKRGPPHEDKHKFFIAANLLQHAEKSLKARYTAMCARWCQHRLHSLLMAAIATGVTRHHG